MLAIRNRFWRAVAVTGLAVGFAGGAHAQTCLQATAPGKDLRQFSRNIHGRMIPGKSVINPNVSTTVFTYNCQPTPGAVGVMSRQINYGQLNIDFSAITNCDEVQTFKGTLVGDYFSLTRLTDPYGDPAFDNTRIGRHNATGRVLDPAGAVVGSFSMVGTIGSNTQRPIAKFGTGPCYWCQHHEGVITIKLTQSPLFTASGVITATYSWDINVDSADCTSDPCKIQQYFDGTMDGLLEAPCGSVKI